jgi:lipoprotein-releasing system ATP-binding protein
MAGARVEISNLRKSYDFGGKPVVVLRGVDLTVEPGEMVAVLGASGAGKSTFLHVVGTLDVPSQGKIRIDDQDVTRLGATQLAAFRNRTIGFVFQFHHLLPEFTAVENVAMPALISGVSQAAATDKAMALLKRVGLTHRLTHRPGELSGGEQQRVALARALVLSPRLLLADEPTGNLDGKTGAEIHDLILSLNHELGMTILVVTHNEQLAERMQRRVRMVEGMLNEVGRSEKATAPATPSPEAQP